MWEGLFGTLMVNMQNTEGNQVCGSVISSFGSWVSPGQSGAPHFPHLGTKSYSPTGQALSGQNAPNYGAALSLRPARLARVG